MSSHPHRGPFRPDDPTHGESELDAVRRRMEADETAPVRFAERHEVLEAEARLVAAGLPEIRRVKTDLAQLLGMSYHMFIHYITGARRLPLDVIASMQIAGDKVPEARAWCLSFARELVGRWGWTLTPPDASGDVVTQAAAAARIASDLAAGTMEDLAGDGVITAAEAGRRLPQAREHLENARRLTAALTVLALGPQSTQAKDPKGRVA